MSHGHRVLVVDGYAEIQEVLQAVLEPRGLRVDRLRRGSQPSDSEAGLPPDLVVIDTEAEPPANRGGTEWNGVPRVIIGSARVPVKEPSPDCQYLHKPFQYPELIAAIERLLPRKVA